MRADKFPHLPAGREPGPQSLRNRVGAPILETFVGLVGTSMFVAGVFVAAGGRGPRFDRTEEALGGAFFALAGLVCALWGWSQLRGRFPARLPRFLRGARLGVDREEAQRGEHLGVTFALAPGVKPEGEELEVGLVCIELWDYKTSAQHRYGATVVRRTAEATAHEEWLPLTPVLEERSFTFQIPGDAPYSYEGDCVSYAWRVSVRAVRRLRSDPRIDHPIWVRP
jgi:hypothetical protein